MALATLTDRDTQAQTEQVGHFTALPLMLVLFQLLLIVLVVREFEIEKSHRLAEVLYIVSLGFAAFVFVPMRLRMVFFLFLSLAVCVQVIGWVSTAWVWGLGFLLIGICHLPITFLAKASLLLTAALTVTYFRVAIDMPFWPILGSMFMFRLFIYFREREAIPTSQPLGMQLSYFFMLPNACFPFYPIVDYRTFCASWFNRPADEISQQGVNWIARGLMHLLLYRVIKYFILPSPDELHTLGDAALFLATNYLLYLRISGAFHLITGILHLFGFNLPRTHENYLLASSFTDLWRRINIYWKQFLERFFFKPAFYRLRRKGVRVALVGAIAYVFVATWVLHSYQVFWLVGTFPITWNELFLWFMAGLFLSVNVLVEFSQLRRRNNRQETSPFWLGFRHSLQVLGVFTTVSLFWACWTMPGLLQQLFLLASNSPSFWRDTWQVIVVLGVAVIAGGIVSWLLKRNTSSPRPALVTRWSDPFSISGNLAVAAILLVLGMPWFADCFDLNTREKLVNLQREIQTPAEVAMAMPGYYELLANVHSQSAPFLGREKEYTPENARIFIEITRKRDDLIGLELIPGGQGILADQTFTINQHGMRNAPITKRKPPNTYRIALVGSSVVMGYGVADNDTFANILEEKINASLPDNALRVEVLNFGCGHYCSLNIAAALRTKIFDFEPDALYYVAHQAEFYGPPKHVAEHFHKKHDLLYPCLENILRDAGITKDTPQAAAATLLQTRASELASCIYSGINNDCRRRGIVPVWLFLPIPGILEKTASDDAIVSSASTSGVELIDLRHWADGENPSVIKIAPTDYHLNAKGHAIVAEAIWQAIQKHPEISPLEVSYAN